MRPQDVSVLLLLLHNEGARKYSQQQLNIQNFPAALYFSRMCDIKNRLNSRGSSRVYCEKDFKHHSPNQPITVTQGQDQGELFMEQFVVQSAVLGKRENKQNPHTYRRTNREGVHVP